MATYTPAQLAKPVAFATTSADLVKPATGIIGIIRTMLIQSPSGSQNATLQIFTATTDTAAARILDAQAITNNVPFILNGWYVVERDTGSLAWLAGKASATTVIFAAWGYNYS